MRIIVAGELPQVKRYRARCRNCGTVFEFAFGETTESPDQRDRGLRWATCPLTGCQKVVYGSAWTEVRKQGGARDGD